MAGKRRHDARAARRPEEHAQTDQIETGPRILAGDVQDWTPAPTWVLDDWLDPRTTRQSPPSPLTDFVGREHETVAIVDLLRDTRLVTLTGAGGIGKTRLAQRVAGKLAAEMKDGVCWVDLVALADPRLIPASIAQALGVREGPAPPLGERLTDFLWQRHLLLVVDNCEHLLEGCASTIEMLLRAAPGLRVLATSREVLGLSGETNWALQPLSLPEAGGSASTGDQPPRAESVESLLRSDAGRLFVQRAQAVRPTFGVTEQNAAAVAEICHRLDVLPLAIELAAARLNVLSAEQIVTRLGDRFRLLTRGGQSVPPRHRTLTSLLEWSHDLLSQDEQVLFRRLAIFAGGWTLEGAEAVFDGGAGDEGREPRMAGPPSSLVPHPSSLDLLSHLVDKSLVLVDEQAGEVRYRFLETLREYATMKLREAGEEALIRHRHAEWLLALVELAEAKLQGPAQADWFDRIEREHDNARLVLDRLDTDERADLGPRLAKALWRFWFARGYLIEGSKRLATILALPGASERTALRAEVLFGAGRVAYTQGAYATARAYFEESLAIAREVQDRERVARSLIAGSLTQLGHLALAEGSSEVARGLYEEALVIRRELGYQREIAISLLGLGRVAHLNGEYHEARSRYEDSLIAAHRAGDRAEIALILLRLGDLAVDEGKLREAHARYTESLTISREIGNRARLAGVLEGFARLAAARGRTEDAIRLCSVAAAAREAIGAQPLPFDRVTLERALAAARRRLGQTASAELWAAGRALSLAEALDLAIAAGASPVAATASAGSRAGSEAQGLTRREREVAALVAGGLSNRQLAERLVITERTAANHVHSILGKLGLRSRVQIAAWAFNRGLTSPK